MSYQNNDQNKIRRRKVDSSNVNSKPSKDFRNDGDKKQTNNTKRERQPINIPNQSNKKNQNINKSNSKKNKKR